MLSEYDQRVRKAIRAEKQERANNACQYNITDRVNDVRSDSPLVLGPINREYVLKMKDTWWAPFTMAKAVDGEGKDAPKLTTDQYRAACELSEAFHIITSPVHARISDPGAVGGGSGRDFDPSIKQVELMRKHGEWITKAQHDRGLCRMHRSGKTYLCLFMDMVQGDTTIACMKREKGLAPATSHRIITMGVDMYVEMHFKGRRK